MIEWDWKCAVANERVTSRYTGTRASLVVNAPIVPLSHIVEADRDIGSLMPACEVPVWYGLDLDGVARCTAEARRQASRRSS